MKMKFIWFSRAHLYCSFKHFQLVLLVFNCGVGFKSFDVKASSWNWPTEENTESTINTKIKKVKVVP